MLALAGDAAHHTEAEHVVEGVGGGPGRRDGLGQGRELRWRNLIRGQIEGEKQAKFIIR